VIASWPIARAAFQERAVRPATIVFTLLMGAWGLFSTEPDAAFNRLSILWVLLLTLTIGGGILADEVDSGHAQLVLLRPITRAQWVTGRFFGGAAVLGLAITLGWLPSFIKAVAQLGTSDLGLRLLALPIGLIGPLAWLATLLALSAVLRSWQNCAAALAAKLGWILVSTGLSLKEPWLKPSLDAIDHYFGPQDPLGVLRQLQAGDVVRWTLPLYDLFWCIAAWTFAVILFEQRELARRRA
jgi:hypothetical protein